VAAVKARTRPEAGAQYELTIESQPQGPDAIARLDGMAVFVPDAAPGDRVTARITEVHPSYARAQVVRIESRSPDRVAYVCPIARDCGGCQWQHLSYRVQCDAKARAVRDTLTRIGGWTEPDVQTTIPSPREFHYRNKATYHVEQRGGALQVGYYGRRTTDLVPLESCPLNMEPLDRALSATVHMLNTEPRFAPVARALRGLTGRISRETGGIVLRFLLKGDVRLRECAEAIADCIDALTGVTGEYTGQRGARRERTLYGSDLLTERVGDQTYRVPASSFFQVNPYATPALVEQVREAAALTGSERLIDAYGGVGLFSRALAGAAQSITLVEADRTASKHARRAFEDAGYSNATVIASPVERLPRTIQADVIVCDPPRQGAGRDALEALHATGAARMVYVACDPANLARDSATLRDLGWDLVRATPVDLFPQTYHIETVALLERH
jgi:23S rRNA (uracil1939-C5)-methyltransferase